MNEERITEKHRVLDYILHVSDGLFWQDILRTLGGGFVIILSWLNTFLEELVTKIITLNDFYASGPVGEFMSVARPIVWGIFLIALIVLGFQFMLNKIEKRNEIVLNVILSVCFVVVIPDLMSNMNQVLSAGINQINSEEQTLAGNVIKSNVADVLYYAEKNFQFSNKKLGDGSLPPKPTSRDFSSIGTTDFTYANRLSDKSAMRIPFTQKLDLHEDDGWIFEEAWVKDLSSEAKDILKTKSVPTGVGDGYQVEKLRKNVVMGTEIGRETYYRYHVNWFPLITSLLVTTFALGIMIIKIGRAIFDLAFHQIFGMFIAVSDLTGGQRTKKVLIEIMNTFVVMFIMMLLLQLFILYSNWANGLKTEIGWLGALVLMIAGAWALIDAPDIVQRMLGIDAGLRNGWQALAGAYAGAKAMKAVGDFTKDRAKNVLWDLPKKAYDKGAGARDFLDKMDAKKSEQGNRANIPEMPGSSKVGDMPVNEKEGMEAQQNQQGQVSLNKAYQIPSSNDTSDTNSKVLNGKGGKNVPSASSIPGKSRENTKFSMNRVEPEKSIGGENKSEVPGGTEGMNELQAVSPMQDTVAMSSIPSNQTEVNSEEVPEPIPLSGEESRSESPAVMSSMPDSQVEVGSDAAMPKSVPLSGEESRSGTTVVMSSIPNSQSGIRSSEAMPELISSNGEESRNKTTALKSSKLDSQAEVGSDVAMPEPIPSRGEESRSESSAVMSSMPDSKVEMRRREGMPEPIPSNDEESRGGLSAVKSSKLGSQVEAGSDVAMPKSVPLSDEESRNGTPAVKPSISSSQADIRESEKIPESIPSNDEESRNGTPSVISSISSGSVEGRNSEAIQKSIPLSNEESRSRSSAVNSSTRGSQADVRESEKMPESIPSNGEESRNGTPAVKSSILRSQADIRESEKMPESISLNGEESRNGMSAVKSSMSRSQADVRESEKMPESISSSGEQSRNGTPAVKSSMSRSQADVRESEKMPESIPSSGKESRSESAAVMKSVSSSQTEIGSDEVTPEYTLSNGEKSRNGTTTVKPAISGSQADVRENEKMPESIPSSGKVSRSESAAVMKSTSSSQTEIGSGEVTPEYIPSNGEKGRNGTTIVKPAIQGSQVETRRSEAVSQSIPLNGEESRSGTTAVISSMSSNQVEESSSNVIPESIPSNSEESRSKTVAMKSTADNKVARGTYDTEQSKTSSIPPVPSNNASPRVGPKKPSKAVEVASMSPTPTGTITPREAFTTPKPLNDIGQSKASSVSSVPSNNVSPGVGTKKVSKAVEVASMSPTPTGTITPREAFTTPKSSNGIGQSKASSVSSVPSNNASPGVGTKKVPKAVEVAPMSPTPTGTITPREAFTTPKPLNDIGQSKASSVSSVPSNNVSPGVGTKKVSKAVEVASMSPTPTGTITPREAFTTPKSSNGIGQSKASSVSSVPSNNASPGVGTKKVPKAVEVAPMSPTPTGTITPREAFTTPKSSNDIGQSKTSLVSSVPSNNVSPGVGTKQPSTAVGITQTSPTPIVQSITPSSSNTGHNAVQYVASPTFVTTEVRTVMSSEQQDTPSKLYEAQSVKVIVSNHSETVEHTLDEIESTQKQMNTDSLGV